MSTHPPARVYPGQKWMCLTNNHTYTVTYVSWKEAYAVVTREDAPLSVDVFADISADGTFKNVEEWVLIEQLRVQVGQQWAWRLSDGEYVENFKVAKIDAVLHRQASSEDGVYRMFLTADGRPLYKEWWLVAWEDVELFNDLSL